MHAPTDAPMTPPPSAHDEARAPAADGAAAGVEPLRARAARLEARLAVYTQYAAVVAEQAAAHLEGDAARVAELAGARERAAEHFEELRAPLAAGHAGPSFRDALDDALAELAHQGAVDSALGRHLAALRDAARRGAGWGGAGPTLALPAAAGGTPAEGPAPAPAPAAEPIPEPAVDGAVDAARGGALVAARAAGVGGVLDGRFPGRAAREAGPAAVDGGPTAGGAPPPGVPAGTPLAHLDLRF